MKILTKTLEKDRLCIEFIDSGIGMEPEKISKLFNAFEQGSVNITRKFGGLGMDLLLEKRSGSFIK